jgi:putative tributyrin esterase
MAFCELHYFSPALQKQTAANVIIPESSSEPFPVFYLLHGLSDDHTSWVRRTSIERYVEELQLMVVMPDGGRGFYLDSTAGFAYETAIVRDLLNFIDQTFRTRAERAGRCLGGLSMGGYGSLRIGFKYSNLFCSVASHSGALNFGRGGKRELEPEFARLLGDATSRARDNLYALAERADRSLLPGLRIDCGTEDELIGANRSFHEHLNQLTVPHEYAEFSGRHDWAYWDLRVQEALRFHARHLGIAR